MVMKNLYGIIFAAMLSATIFCNDLYAQNKHDLLTGLDEHDFSTFTINGLVIGGPEEYTEQDIIDAFGQPDSVYFDYGVGYVYLYGMKVSSAKKDYVPVGEYSISLSMLNKTDIISSIAVFDESSLVNGYIRVGDPISKVYDMGGRFHKADYGGGKGAVYWCPSGWGNADWIVCPEFNYNANGIITYISCWQY